MQRTINRYGEFTVTENKGILKTMYQNLDPLITVDIIQKNYVDKIEKLGFSSNILVIQHFSKVYDGIEFTYSLKNKLPYIDIRGLQFNEQLVLFKSLISVATLSEKHNTVMLWEKENFLIDTETDSIKALLFEFEGYPIHFRQDNHNGLKNMILLGLTNLQKITGMPKRINFIDQSDNMIQFANHLLLCKNNEEIEYLIDQSILHEEEIRLTRMSEIEQKRKFKRLRKKEDTLPLTVDYKRLMKQQLVSAGSTKDKVVEDNRRITLKLADKLMSPKGLIILTVILGFLVTFVFSILPNMLEGQNKTQTAELVKIKDKTTNSYRYYVQGNKEKAYAVLDGIGYENLPTEKDRKVLIQYYIEQDKFTKALTTDKKSAYQIGDHLITKNRIEELKKLEEITKNKVLTFDVATVNREYQAVIQYYPDLTQTNDRRGNELVRAYFLTNQPDELEKLIASFETGKKGETNPTSYLLRQIQQNLYNEFIAWKTANQSYEEKKGILEGLASDSPLRISTENEVALLKNQRDVAIENLENKVVKTTKLE